MKRYNRFKMLNDIQDEYILESMPDYLAIRAKKRFGENAVLSFLSSGWGAACICALVAVGVMAFIIRAGQNPWTPPATTVESSTESQTPETEPSTETETETETEEDTTPYFDPELLDIDTYQGMTPDVPYTISYASLGDGTCIVNGITVNILYEGEFTVEIPETSPDGDTVVGVSIKPTYNIPAYVSAEDFPKIKAAALEYYGNDENNFFFKQFMSYVQLKGLEFYSSENLKNDLLSDYPIAAYTNIYVFDDTATEIEYALRSRTLATIAPWYTAEWCYADMLKLKELAELHGVTDAYLDQVLAMHSGSFENVSEIRLPKTLQPGTLDPQIFSVMGFESLTFGGTVAEMTAIADPADNPTYYPLVIHCTDGDINYPVKE